MRPYKRKCPLKRTVKLCREQETVSVERVCPLKEDLKVSLINKLNEAYLTFVNIDTYKLRIF